MLSNYKFKNNKLNNKNQTLTNKLTQFKFSMPNFYENGKNYIQEQILLLKFKFNNFLEKKENLIKIILTIFVAYLLT